MLRPDADSLPVFSQTSGRKHGSGAELACALTPDRWKKILTTSGEELLLDLGADPYELESGRVQVLSTEEAEGLRSLGYGDGDGD